MSGNSSESDPTAKAVDLLVEDILNLSDEELLAEVTARGDDPHAIAARMRTMFSEKMAVRGRQRLTEARAAVNADKARLARIQNSDPTAARRRLDQIMKRFPRATEKLTLAARNGRGLSDNDVVSMLADLEELGLTGEEEE